MEEFNLFVENQYEFREKLYYNLDQGKVTRSVFLDLLKASDTVDHNILIEKLIFYSFSEPAHSFIKSYLTKK